MCQYWYENGQKEIESTFKNGNLDGLYQFWYKDGEKGGECTFKNGEKDGFCQFEKCNYKNGKKVKHSFEDCDNDVFTYIQLLFNLSI